MNDNFKLPENWYVITTQDNVDDRMKKGLQGHSAPKTPAHGEAHGMHKLSGEQVAEIRRQHADRLKRIPSKQSGNRE